ncbi:unnamed protein product [Thlaspi arvense]|uniref:Uncharacterized protein n=1 Tax=Thlaspi arvense TaxID=13288 RepID=A0AAU9RTP1_THLAR|nr:unnamed protein product [Thlaspi arvense]
MASSEVLMNGYRGGENFPSASYSDPKDYKTVSAAREGYRGGYRQSVCADYSSSRTYYSVNVATSHPLISGTLALRVGIFALKKTRRFVYYNTLRMFLREEALLSRADLKVKELRQSMDRLIAEGQKLEIFKHFSSLDVEDVTDVKSGYSITFHFSPNPYFEDGKLTKIYNFLEEGTTKITTTSIQWKEGKSLPNGVNHEKKGNKRALPEESFFTWFRDAQHKEDNEEEIQDEVADEEDFEGDDGNERKEGNSDEDDNDEEEEDGEE